MTRELQWFRRMINGNQPEDIIIYYLFVDYYAKKYGDPQDPRMLLASMSTAEREQYPVLAEKLLEATH